MGLRVGDCTRGSAEKCVRLQLCFLVPTLDCQVLEINCIIFLDKRAAPSNVGWMPSLLIKPGFPQKGCQLSMKPTWFAGHHLDSQRWKDAMRLYMTSLVTLGRGPEKMKLGKLFAGAIAPSLAMMRIMARLGSLLAGPKPGPVSARLILNMSSPVWSFFIVAEDNSIAVCKNCSARIPRGGKKTSTFDTSNIIAHLKNRHCGEVVLKEYEAAVVAAIGAAKAKTTRSVDVPIREAFENCKKFSRDSEKAKAINDKVMEFIELDDQPFSVVENPGFHNLIALLEPRYTLPSGRFFSDVSLPALYDIVATHIHNLIDKNGLHVSFTTDLWTSDVSPVSTLSLTAQWLDQDFNMQKAMLHSQECSGSHTTTMLCQAFDGMLAQ